MKIVSVEPVSESEAEALYELPQSNAGAGVPFLQSPKWAAFKSAYGWRQYFFKLKSEDETHGSVVSCCLVLIKKFPVFGSLAYIPMGPAIPENADFLRILGELSKIIRPMLPRDTFCIRYDPPCEKRGEPLSSGVRGIRKARVDIQPPDTVILDLTLSSAELLEQMKSKWRYNIRLAEKKGVTIRVGTPGEIGLFYSLYQETAARDGIAIHGRAYYEKLLSLSDEHFTVRLYIAEHEGQPLAAIITLFTPSEAVYLYGASSNEKRNLMPTYLLQWIAMNDASACGSRRYDLYGIPPVDDENHPMYGLYRFKTGFGGRIVHRVGSWDVPCKKGAYFLYDFLEKARAFWFKKVKKLFLKKHA